VTGDHKPEKMDFFGNVCFIGETYIAKISKTIGDTEPVEYNAAESQLNLFVTKQRLDVVKYKATCERQGSILR
jgi:hypothetical protein